MYLSKFASRRRISEAENARKNRMDIVKALSHGEISKRDLFRWGLLTTTGAMALKNGLSQYATSAFAAVPTGTPLSPLFGAKKFSEPMPRQHVQPRHKLVAKPATAADGVLNTGETNVFHWADPKTGQVYTDANGKPRELASKFYSYHEDFTRNGTFKNPVTGVGPAEGRPDSAIFGHQRFEELPPQIGFILSLGQIAPNTRFNSAMPAQNPDSVWSFGTRAVGAQGNINGSRFGLGTCPLVKLRYGEPAVTRIYNDLPDDVTKNEGFGRNEISTHFHNAHNGAESDGACNAYHFPGTFYDYHWPTVMARRDYILKGNAAGLPTVGGGNLTQLANWQQRCSGPDDGDGLVQIPGDFREIQGTLWFHDHRFFFTAENVHKGNFAMCNMYSGPDRGRDTPDAAGINLTLPSGNLLPWGNIDFDVNLAITNPAFKSGAEAGQLYFDIFDTDGFLGDMLLVNGSYYPYMEVLPRRYRFRTLNASMSRFIKLALAVQSAKKQASGSRVPFWFIANDGNFVVKPILMTSGEMDEQGVAERYDIVIDFSQFSPGDTLFLVNTLQQTNGRKPDGAVSMATALSGTSQDPAVGPILQFRVVNQVQSVDDPTKTWYATDKDNSADFTKPEWQPIGSKKLTEQIPIVAPKRTRTIEWVRANGDSRANPGGVCIPECGDIVQFPWSVKVDGKAAHSLNGNRISELIHDPGEVEHWTYINGGGGWDHPIHLHFEEGVTMNRGNAAIPSTELLVRKDVWRLRPSGQVTFQVRFGEFGGAYVNHCHNTVHEDFAMLLRYQLLRPGSTTHADVTKTPLPSRTGVTWLSPEVLPEGDFRTRSTAATAPATTTTSGGGGSGKGKG